MAGASIPGAEGKGGRKQVDFIVNLVPTIDLLSVLITFLLLTAVWTQLARINVDQAVQKTQDKPQQEQKEPEKMLNILVGKEGISLNFTGEEAKHIPRKFEVKNTLKMSEADSKEYLKIIDTYAESFQKILKAEFLPRVKKDEKGEIIQRVILASEDEVQYTFMILVMDACLTSGLTKIVVADDSAVKTELL
jgi:biopolymer transport protein ExbD